MELKDLDEQLPQQLDWAGYDEFGGADGSFTRNGHTISAEKARLYLFDDLGVSQRWTNKFSEVGIETVGDLGRQVRGRSAAHRWHRCQGDRGAP